MKEKTLRVFSLTDVETAQLREKNAVGMTFAVGRALLGPGQDAVTADDVMTRQHLERFVMMGAAAINTLPPSYVVAKEKKRAADQAAASLDAARAKAQDPKRKKK